MNSKAILSENNMELEDDTDSSLNYSITSYGADIDVEGLVKRIDQQDIYIPSFQRGYVWKPNDASKFIESLLFGLPVPGIFLAKDESEKFIVIDGQQRLWTLWSFYKGKFPNGQKFSLKGIQSEFKKKTYETLSSEDKRRLNNTVIHATIIKQDKPEDGGSSIYHIFERLNTGGKRLTSQEIRSAMYHGEFDNLLTKLNENKLWRELYGKGISIEDRARGEELILRFLALYYAGENYSTSLIYFLNEFMNKHRYLKDITSETMELLFTKTIHCVDRCLGEKAFIRNKKFNAAVFDAIMVGIAKRLEKQEEVKDTASFSKAYESLLKDQSFSEATSERTSAVKYVKQRLEIAITTFANVL